MEGFVIWEGGEVIKGGNGIGIVGFGFVVCDFGYGGEIFLFVGKFNCFVWLYCC